MLFQERDTDNISLSVHILVSQQEAEYIPVFHMCSSTDCSSAPYLQCHESAFTNIFLFPASQISICKQHIIHIPIMGMSEGNNLYLQSEVSKQHRSVLLKAGYVHCWCWYCMSGKEGSLMELGRCAAYTTEKS